MTVTAAFPAPPWTLRGWGVVTLGLVDARVARRFVPSAARVVCVWPGKTLAGLVFATYEAGSTLAYHEVAVVSALVRIGNRFGFWLPRLYVDDSASLAGGRALWGLPKHLATFSVGSDGLRRSIDVLRSEVTAFSAQKVTRKCGLPVHLPVPIFGELDGAFLFTLGRLRGDVAVARARIYVNERDLHPLGLQRRLLALSIERLELVFPAARTCRVLKERRRHEVPSGEATGDP